MALETAQLAYAAYKNRSAIKRFLKWLVIAVCAFAFFSYLVVATVLTVISDGFKPPVTTPAPAASQTNQ